MAIGKDSHCISSIIKYDVINHKSSTLTKFDEPLRCKPDTTAIDSKNNAIYIVGKAGIYRIDLNTNTYTTQLIVDSTRFRSGGWEVYVLTTIINNKLHIFSHQNDRYKHIHTIYDIKSDDIERKIVALPLDDHGFAAEFMLYIKSKMRVLCIARWWDKYIMSYDMNKNSWERMKKIKLSSNQSFLNHGVVMAKNERYVIVFHSWSEWIEADGPGGEEVYYNQIDVLDFKTGACRISSVELPSRWKDEGLHTFLVDGHSQSDIVINGYLREYWKKKELINVMKLPIAVIGIIIQFFRKEYVHLIQRKSGKHWKISVDNILD